MVIHFSLISRLLKSPLPTRGKRAYWYAKINMVICSLCRRLNVFRPRLLKSPLPSRDKWVRWHAETVMVIHFSLISRLLKSPLSTRGKQARWHAETNMVIYPLWSKTQYLSTETIRVSPSSSRDNQVWWHTETNVVTRFRFLDYF